MTEPWRALPRRAKGRGSSGVERGGARASSVVMAHGFGATRRCGLDAFAERFQKAGLHALQDWDSAIAYARGRDHVLADRIALW